MVLEDESDRLFAEGEAYVDEEAYDEALELFQSAWEALPEPKEEQETTLPLLAAIVDCQFFLGQWEACQQSVQTAFRHGAELDNSFFRLRLGQALFEMGEVDQGNQLVSSRLFSRRLGSFRG